MPNLEKEIRKLYYSMGEVATMLDLSQSLIRYWEKEFDALTPKKNKKGNRLFTQKDLECLKLIHRLLKVEGYTLEGAKRYLKENSKELNQENKLEVVSTPIIVETTTNEIKNKLLEIKKKLIELKERI